MTKRGVKINPNNNSFLETFNVIFSLAGQGDVFALLFLGSVIIPIFFFFIVGIGGGFSVTPMNSANSVSKAITGVFGLGIVFFSFTGLLYVSFLLRVISKTGGFRSTYDDPTAKRYHKKELRKINEKYLKRIQGEEQERREKKMKENEELFYKVQAMNQEKIED